MSAQTIKLFRRHALKHIPREVQRAAAAPTSTITLQLPNPFIPRKHPVTGKWIPPKYSLRRQADIVKAAKRQHMLDLIPAGPKMPPNKLAAALQHQPYIDITAFAKEQQAKALKAAATKSTSKKEAVENNGPKEAEDEMILTPVPEFAPVEWQGEVKVKEVPGSETGTRLYAGKKRMFKGHKWERIRESVEKKRKILMRDMAKRIYNYKMYYKRRRPDPLKPPRTTKAPKLPF
ncbi:hypothetical protein AX16_007837 [Volvariella volvacea WC 439]|nr:hypothetical protein AX16_007837 [Volvariella volvacea WC 439]